MFRRSNFLTVYVKNTDIVIPTTHKPFDPVPIGTNLDSGGLTETCLNNRSYYYGDHSGYEGYDLRFFEDSDGEEVIQVCDDLAKRDRT